MGEDRRINEDEVTTVGLWLHSDSETVALLCGNERVREDIACALRVNPGALEVAVRSWASVHVAEEFRGSVHRRWARPQPVLFFAVCFQPLPFCSLARVVQLAQQFFVHSCIASVLPWADCVLEIVVPWNDAAID